MSGAAAATGAGGRKGRPAAVGRDFLGPALGSGVVSWLAVRIGTERSA